MTDFNLYGHNTTKMTEFNMKKIILLSLVLFSTLSVSSQNWTLYEEEADELKGTPARSSHIAEIPDVGLVVIFDDTDRMGFVTYKGIFDYKPYKYLTIVNGIFGMYDEKGELVEKANIMISVSEESPNSGNAYLNAVFNNESLQGIKRVVSWIRNNKGSVRIVIPKYGDADFDVKVPTFLSQKQAESRGAPKSTTQKRTKAPVRKYLFY